MTLSTTTRVKRYDGNDSTTVFPYDFRILDEEHLTVILTDADDEDTTLVITTHYTVDGVGDASGGNVTMLTPPATGETLTIYRVVPQTQSTDFQNQGPYAAQTNEDALDKLVMMIQDVQNDADRAVKVDITDTTDPDVLIEDLQQDAVDAAASAAEAAAEVVNCQAEVTNCQDEVTNCQAEVVNCQTEVTYAAEWANKAEDSLISSAAGGDEVDDYSALHHAAKASAARIAAESAAASVNSDAYLVNQTDYAILDADGYLTILVNTGASNRTITLPTVADNEDRQLVIKKIDSGAGEVIVDGEGAETIDGSATLTIDAQYEAYRLQSDGSEWHLVSTYAEAADATPSGAIMAFAMESAPTGWLECDGSDVSRTTYAALFAAIGTAYGYGDNSTTFTLPDFRGKFVRGWDHGAGNDPDAASRTAQDTGGDTGDNVGSVQDHELDSHTHTDNRLLGAAPATIAAAGSDYKISDASVTGATGGSETRPINAYAMYCIKV